MTDEPFVARLTSGHKVTIPKHIAALYALEDGSYVELRFVRVVKLTVVKLNEKSEEKEHGDQE